MNIKIGAKIKMLRKRDDITQERLAEVLGVTNQAISRWESESGYPDIEYISPIANFFNVSTDYLFDHDIAEKRKKIDEYCEQFDAHYREWKPAQERVDMMRQALAEFPAEEKLLIRLANALYYKWCEYGLHSKWVDGYFVYDAEKHKSFDSWDEALKIMEELLATSVDDKIRMRCRQLLAYIYGKIGEKEKLLAITEKCDDIQTSRQSLLSSMMDGKDGMKYIQEELLGLLREFIHPFGRIARFYIRDTNAIIDSYTIMINLYKFIFSDGNFGFYNFDLWDLYLTYAHEFSKQNDFDKTFEALENSRNHAKMFDIYLNEIREKGEVQYTAPYVDMIKQKSTDTYAVKQLPALLKYLEDENGFFAQIQSDPRLPELIKKIESDIAET